MSIDRHLEDELEGGWFLHTNIKSFLSLLHTLNPTYHPFFISQPCSSILLGIFKVIGYALFFSDRPSLQPYLTEVKFDLILPDMPRPLYRLTLRARLWAGYGTCQRPITLAVTWCVLHALPHNPLTPSTPPPSPHHTSLPTLLSSILCVGICVFVCITVCVTLSIKIP